MIFLSPWLILLFLLKSFKIIKDIEKKFGSLYESLNTESKDTVIFYAIFILRRVLFSMLVVLMSD